jgi:uncharacterized phage-associated protein
MAITFVFDLRKTIAATAFLAQQEQGTLDMFLSLKMLYVADRKSLASWGKTITGDKMVSMPKGPVLSTIYNLFKGIGRVDHLKEWNLTFGETVGNSIQLRRPADFGALSEDEMEMLEDARKEIHSVAPWEVARWLHESCPEWIDPLGSSVRIDPKIILRNSGRSEEEILMIEESSIEFQQIDAILSAL